MLYATSSYGGFLRPEDTILEPVFITGGCRKDGDFSHQTRRFSREAPQNGAFSAKPADDGHTDRAVAESHMAGMRPARRRAAAVNTGSKSPSAVAPAVFYLNYSWICTYCARGYGKPSSQEQFQYTIFPGKWKGIF